MKQQKKEENPSIVIIEFLAINDLITKLTLHNMPFLKTQVYITKGYHPLSFVENPWLRRTILKQCSHIVFPFQYKGDKFATKNCVKNQGETRSTITCFLCYMHGIFWLNVLWWTWYPSCQFYQQFIRAHTCHNGVKACYNGQ